MSSRKRSLSGHLKCTKERNLAVQQLLGVKTAGDIVSLLPGQIAGSLARWLGQGGFDTIQIIGGVFVSTSRFKKILWHFLKKGRGRDCSNGMHLMKCWPSTNIPGCDFGQKSCIGWLSLLIILSSSYDFWPSYITVREFGSNCSTLTIVILMFGWFFWFGLNEQLASKSYLCFIVWKCDDNATSGNIRNNFSLQE